MLPAGSALQCSWDQPSNGACVSRYEVLVTPLSGPSMRSASPQSTSDGSLTIQGLQPDTAYKVQSGGGGGTHLLQKWYVCTGL